MTDQQAPVSTPTDTPQPVPHLAPSSDVKAPDNCPSCGAPLANVPDVKDTCPHCAHPLLEDIAHFGAKHWHRLPKALRDNDPELGVPRDITGAE